MFSDSIDVAQAEDVFKLGAGNTFRVALEYRHESDTTSPITGAEIFYNVFSASAMWNWQLSPMLTLTNAVRLDDLALGRDGYTPPGYPLTNQDWDRQLRVPSFNSGLLWRLDDNDTLRLMAARGTLLPNLVELGALLYQTPAFGVTGTPTLSPTGVENYEVDWDRTVPQLQSQLRATVFYQITEGMTVLDGGVLAGPAGFYVTPENIGNSSAAGASLTVDGRLADHWRWGTYLRYERVRQDFSAAAAAGVGAVDPQNETPARQAKFNFGWNQDRWECDAYLLYQSQTAGLAYNGLVAGTLIVVPAYASLNARIAYQFTSHLGLALSGQNLLHQQQMQTSGEPVQRRWLATITATL
jgi:outer membrane receptor for ferrienterochelin and colicins